MWSGLGASTLATGTFPSLQMCLPSLPPSTRFNSPALSIHSIQPSPLLSALPSPSVSSFSLPPDTNHPPAQRDQSPLSTPQSLFVEPATSQILPSTQLLSGQPWSPRLQETFENWIARLTAAAGLPLSWVDNLEWIDFVHDFLPCATSPSRKVLSTRLIPRIAESYRQLAKGSSKDQNATLQADGWTAVNFHHLIAFMMTVNKKVGFVPHRLREFLQITSPGSHDQCT